MKSSKKMQNNKKKVIKKIKIPKFFNDKKFL